MGCPIFWGGHRRSAHLSTIKSYCLWRRESVLAVHWLEGEGGSWRGSINLFVLTTNIIAGTSNEVAGLEGERDIGAGVLYQLQDQCWFWHYFHSSELQTTKKPNQAGASNLRDHMPATAASNWFNYICLNSPRTLNPLKGTTGRRETHYFGILALY